MNYPTANSKNHTPLSAMFLPAEFSDEFPVRLVLYYGGQTADALPQQAFCELTITL